jgi:hypothetical protein
MSEHWTRREMLAATASLCVATAFRVSPFGASLNMIDPPPFNVILHGLFVLDIIEEEGTIHISSPDCTNMASHKPHKYRAGSWQKRFDNFKDVKGDYTPRWSPTPPNGKPDLTEAPNLTAHMGKPKHDRAYFSITLPFPMGIMGYRAFTKAEVEYPSCCMTGTKFPLVLALGYRSAPNDALIPGTNWDKTKNFHIFAEPEDPMGCGEAAAHGQEAMRRLWSMFDVGPDFSGPIPRGDCYKPPEPLPTTSGVIKDEELSLSELKTFSSGKASTEGINLPMCATLIAP